MRLREAGEHLARPAFDDVRDAVGGQRADDRLDPAHRARGLARERVADRVRARRCSATSTLCSTGICGARDRDVREPRASCSAAGAHQRAVERRRHRQQHAALRALAPCAAAIARSTASLWPAITSCAGALKLTGSTHLALRTLPRRRRAPRRRRGPGSPPSRPRPAGTASCIACARKRTSGTASANASAPAATSAVYSPRLWPATTRRLRAARRLPCAPHRDAGRQHHRLRVRRQVERVGRTFVDQRPQILAERLGRLGERLAHDRDASAKPFSMPTDCEPCPGNTNAMLA